MGALVNNRIFCTRGSFCSDQALRAEQIFNKDYMDEDVNMECTYCFEVIYPQNKIVVDYGAVEDIFLISIIHTKTGKNVNINQAGFNTVEKIATNGICYTTGCSAGNDIIFLLISQPTKHVKNTFRGHNVTESIAFGYQVSKNYKWIILIVYISVCLSPEIGDIAKNTKKNEKKINKYFVLPPIS